MIERLSNSTRLWVTRDREAHRTGNKPRLTHCSTSIFGMQQMSFAQLLVFVKPAYCSRCFPGGAPH